MVMDRYRLAAPAPLASTSPIAPLHIDYFPLQPEADIAELMQVGHAQQELTRALVDCNPPVWLVWLFNDLDFTHWNGPVSTQLPRSATMVQAGGPRSN
jgi:hypothetical protein